MPWQPGQSGNPKGRPSGARNKSGIQARNFIAQFIEDDSPLAVEDWQALTPWERWQVRTRLMDFVLPKLQRVEAKMNIDRLSDEEVDSMLDAAIEKLNEHERQTRDPQGPARRRD